MQQNQVPMQEAGRELPATSSPEITPNDSFEDNSRDEINIIIPEEDDENLETPLIDSETSPTPTSTNGAQLDAPLIQ